MKAILFSILFIHLVDSQAQLYEYSTALKHLIKAVDECDKDSIAWHESMSIQELDAWYEEADTFLSNTRFNILQQQIQANKKDWGLQLESSANYYFREVSDLENNNPLQSLISSGISWKVLKDGYVGNQIQAARWQNTYELQKLDQARIDKKIKYEHLYNRIIYQNHLQRKEVLEKRSAFIERHLAVLNQLFRQRELHWEELELQKHEAMNVSLDLTSSIRYIESFEKVYADYFVMQEKRLFPNCLIEIQRVLAIDSGFQQNKRQLLLNNIEQQYQNAALPSLSVNGRLNYRASRNSTDVFPSIGLQLKFPIRFGKSNQNLEQLERQDIEESELLAELSRQKELMNDYYEFEFKRKHFEEYQQELSLLKEEIFKSHLLYKTQLRTDFFWTSIGLIHRKQKIELACLDALKDMQLQLLKMYSKSNASRPSELMKPKIKEKINTIRIIVPLTKMDSNQLLFYAQYLRVNQWKHIYIPTQTDSANQVSLNQHFGSYGVHCHFALPKNEEFVLMDVTSFETISDLFQSLEIHNRKNPSVIILIQDLQQIIALEEKELSISRNEKF